MDFNELIKKISEELQKGNNVEFEHAIKNITYKIIFQKPDYENGINISSIIAIPLSKNIGEHIILESNNIESESFEQILEQGIQVGIKLAKLTESKPTTIVIPLIPSYRNAPYFQQLSRECLLLSSQDRNYRIDEQVIRIIDKAKRIVKEKTKINLEDKIFINGYSSSGVFAQRFALLHPELIDTACIGGASGSIPIPTEALKYPLGIEDYKELTGKEFDMNNYSQINFIYYVGEFEAQNKAETRVDENGNLAPMHDMSYFDRSIPKETGQKQRELFGKNMFDRIEKEIELLNELGIKIEHTVIPGRSHNNNGGIGVNEIGDSIVIDTYNSFINSKYNRYTK